MEIIEIEIERQKRKPKKERTMFDELMDSLKEALGVKDSKEVKVALATDAEYATLIDLTDKRIALNQKIAAFNEDVEVESKILTGKFFETWRGIEKRLGLTGTSLKLNRDDRFIYRMEPEKKGE